MQSYKIQGEANILERTTQIYRLTTIQNLDKRSVYTHTHIEHENTKEQSCKNRKPQQYENVKLHN